MIYKIFAIKDVKVGFMQPFMQVNVGVAVREFKNLVNSGNSVVSVNYTDMQLFCLGTYNLDTGAIESDVKFVINGSEVKDVSTLPNNFYADVKDVNVIEKSEG